MTGLPMPADHSLIIPAPFGGVRLTARRGALVAVDLLAGEVAVPAGGTAAGLAGVDASDAVLQRAGRELASYFAGHGRTFSVPVDLSGRSPFTVTILELLRAIPYGTTITYGELAALAGSPRAARAVGRAVATNPLPIIIPCHRVVAAGGRPGGYSGGGGLATKAWLLRREGASASEIQRFFSKKALDRGAGFC